MFWWMSEIRFRVLHIHVLCSHVHTAWTGERVALASDRRRWGLVDGCGAEWERKGEEKTTKQETARRSGKGKGRRGNLLTQCRAIFELGKNKRDALVCHAPIDDPAILDPYSFLDASYILKILRIFAIDFPALFRRRGRFQRCVKIAQTPLETNAM